VAKSGTEQQTKKKKLNKNKRNAEMECTKRQPAALGGRHSTLKCVVELQVPESLWQTNGWLP
jgi:hypothetical protein